MRTRSKPWLNEESTPCSPQSPQFNTISIQRIGDALKGEVIAPEDVGYDVARAVFNFLSDEGEARAGRVAYPCRSSSPVDG